MNIGIDVSALGEPNYTGIGVYTENLVRELGEIDSVNRYYLCYRLSRLKYRWLDNPVEKPNFSVKIIQEPLNFLFARKLDLFHGPAERLVDYPRPKKVVTIHDMAALKGGDFMTEQFREMVRRRYTELVAEKKADAIITVSESSKRDICDYFQADPERIKVVHHGVSGLFRPMPEELYRPILEKLGVTSPYFLNVGAQQERKNIVRVVRAFHAYLKNGGRGNLVLSGKPTYGYERIPEAIRELGLEDRVKHIGHVGHDELVALYSGAAAFVFPSLYEGFGLPILEAFACGCPVVTGNLTACPEVAGDAAIIVDPLSEEAITGALEKMSDPAVAREYSQKGLKRASIFTWENCARGTLEVYKSLL